MVNVTVNGVRLCPICLGWDKHQMTVLVRNSAIDTPPSDPACKEGYCARHHTDMCVQVPAAPKDRVWIHLLFIILVPLLVARFMGCLEGS